RPAKPSWTLLLQPHAARAVSCLEATCCASPVGCQGRGYELRPNELTSIVSVVDRWRIGYAQIRGSRGRGSRALRGALGVGAAVREEALQLFGMGQGPLFRGSHGDGSGQDDLPRPRRRGG